MSAYTAIILGATGLVGKELLKVVLSNAYYQKIIVVSRRTLDIEDSRVKVIVLDDFENLERVQPELIGHDYYCALGTTIKKAGSKEKFRKVDFEYPVSLAHLAKKSPDFSQYLIVTAVGASPKSSIFYNRVKGEVEEELRNMGLPALKIFQPSLLLGDREEFRLGEEFAKVMTRIVSFFMMRSKRRLWSIKATEVAEAMFFAARKKTTGVMIFRSDDMLNLINTLRS